MAIQDSFNLSRATTSQAYAYKCWYNYNYGGNTMKISSKDMGEITQTWNGELKNWRATASNDENAYEIDDDDFSTAKNNGKDSAKDKTGYEGGGKGKMWVRGGLDFASGAAGTLSMYTAAGQAVANKIGTKLGGKLVEKSAEKVVGKAAAKAGKEAAAKALEGGATKEVAKQAGKKAATKAGEETTKKAANSAGAWSIAAPLALAVGVAYKANKPNKEQKEACDELQNTMNDAQASLTQAQSDMSDYSDEIADLSDQAQAQNEDANDEIVDKKTEYDMYKASYDALMEKANSGEALTDDEKSLLKELIPLMQELGAGITETSEETTDAVGEIYDEMGTYQDGYDNAASTMAEVEGVTDYAESFDDATRTLCYVEAGSQTLNTVSGGKAAAKATAAATASFGFNAWAWACAAMGATGATLSLFGAKEQYQWAGDVGTEIGLREATQDMNATSLEMYDENIDIYAGQMQGVEDLELEIPEGMDDPEGLGEELGAGAAALLEQPETPPAGTSGTGNLGGGTSGNPVGSSTNEPNDPNKKKDIV